MVGDDDDGVQVTSDVVLNGDGHWNTFTRFPFVR